MNNLIFKKVANDLNLPEAIVAKTYKAYWLFIKTSIQSLPLKEEILTQDEFNKLNVSYNIPSIGKLYCNYDKYLCKKIKFNKLKLNKHDKYQED